MVAFPSNAVTHTSRPAGSPRRTTLRPSGCYSIAPSSVLLAWLADRVPSTCHPFGALRRVGVRPASSPAACATVSSRSRSSTVPVLRSPRCVPPWMSPDARYDFNGNGVVDIYDIGVVVAAWKMPVTTPIVRQADKANHRRYSV